MRRVRDLWAATVVLTGLSWPAEETASQVHNRLCRPKPQRRAHAIETLYLQTEHLGGGLYGNLGWTLVQAHHEGGVDQVVMVRNLAPHGTDEAA